MARSMKADPPEVSGLVRARHASALRVSASTASVAAMSFCVRVFFILVAMLRFHFSPGLSKHGLAMVVHADGGSRAVLSFITIQLLFYSIQKLDCFH
jgi:hypothetical protein